MRKIDDEIQTLLKEYQGDIKQILTDNHRLDYLYALSGQREMLLEWYDFDPQASLLQVGADYGAMTGLYSDTVSQVTVLDEDQKSLETVSLRFPNKLNIEYRKDSLVQFAADPGSPRFDYVVIAGMMTAPYEEQIQAAKTLLKPDGILIVAAANPLGMKYLAGTEKESDALSKQTLIKLLGGDSRFYYPMPDYRTPISIYSDDYLPQKGDMTRVIPAYDYPRYHMMDMGESFDTVCEDGLFEWYANSYLVFWSSNREKLWPQEDRIYIKYNKTRTESFQIKTSICVNRDSQERFVEKAALSLDGMGHIWSFEEKYKMLEQQHKSQSLHVARPVFRENQNAVLFPYLEGETWAGQLGEKLSHGEAPVETMQKALDIIFDIHPQFRTAFESSQEFLEVFGSGLTAEDLDILAKDTACAASNIDALFENILLTEEGIFCLDYEWVFLFPVPEHFVHYRILYYFYEQYSSLMSGLKRETFLEAFGITSQMAEIYARMEENFQNYVHGENRDIYMGNYMVYSK